MGDPLRSFGLRKDPQATGLGSGQKVANKSLVTSISKSTSQNKYGPIVRLSRIGIASGPVGDAALFLLKIAALEAVRRFSRAKCPFVWHGIQALQLLCYPPFKWIQRWSPFKGLVDGAQILSRPFLVLSIATAVTDELGWTNETSNDSGDDSYPEPQSEQSSVQSNSDLRICDEVPQHLEPEDWLIKLQKELDSQEIDLPERMNKDELYRFYSAANGDFPCFLSSIKKTIRWRENFRILSGQELQVWSDMVFWHGFDVKHRPCLIVRLGLACFSLPSHDRPRFAQAIVSQVEHGVLHLVDRENPQITVLLDCEGLPTLRFPMQMMRSCSSLLQDHFPNRLGCLFVIRLPPLVRVMAQTFIQVLKPVTREKLKIIGSMYKQVLAEYLESVPSLLGGKCTCARCSKPSIFDLKQPQTDGISKRNRGVSDDENQPLSDPIYEIDVDPIVRCGQAVRTAMMSLIILCILIAFMSGIFDPESRPFLPS